MSPALLLLALAAPASTAEEPLALFREGRTEWAYRRHEVRGWTVLVQEPLPGREGLAAEVVAALEDRLARVEADVPAPAVRTLKGVTFWVSEEPGYPLRKGEKGLLTYHPAASWLRDHGLNPSMEGGIHIINPEHVLHTHRKFERTPMVVLHELSHAYERLTPGATERLEEAYLAATGKGLYASVSRWGDASRTGPAYAANNHREYFAELTEALFGLNDYFPRTRDELETYDPEGAALARSLWGLPAPPAPVRAIPADPLLGLQPLAD